MSDEDRERHVDHCEQHRAPATAHLDPADAVPILFPNPDGTAGTILTGDLRALTQYIDRRDGN